MDGENYRFVFTHIPFYLPACKELVRYYIIIMDSPNSLGINGSYCSKASNKPMSSQIASHRKRADANCIAYLYFPYSHHYPCNSPWVLISSIRAGGK